MGKRSRKKKTPAHEVSVRELATDADAKETPSWLSADGLLALALVVAVLLAYQPVWYAGFIWDDDSHVTANPCIVGPLGLKEIWTTSAASICPLTLTTFWVEHALWGLNPLPYHVVNVFLHAACAIGLWRVLRSLPVPGAWLSAALWALSPVQVESVAWIAELKNTQSCLFYLLSILFFVSWLKTRENPKRSGWDYALTLLFAALAMASKSSTVILPVVLGLCAWWVEGRWHWRNLLRLSPIFLMSVAAALVTMWTQKLEEASVQLSPRNWPERLVTAGDAVWFYLGKLLWPHPLMTIYPRWEIDAGAWLSYLPLAAVIAVLLMLGLKSNAWTRPCFFVFAYFLAASLPTLGLVDNTFYRYSFVADHFQYLASMGPLALAGAGMARLAEVMLPGMPRLQGMLYAGVLLILGALSWRQAWIYESEETLWADALAKNPACWLGRERLGNALLRKGRTDQAMAQFQKGVELNPEDAESRDNLGMALDQNGRVNEAMALFRKSLENNPNDAEALDNLGLTLDQIGEVDAAIAQYEETVRRFPNLAPAYYGLGFALAQKGRLDEAIVQYQKALAIRPSDAETYNNLGVALFQRGRAAEAISAYQTALEIRPAYAEAHNNLGVALFQTGRPDEALAQFQKALQFDPTYPDALNGVGNVLLRRGHVDEAIADYQKALATKPNGAEIHNSLGVALFQKGQVNEAIAQFQAALRFKPNYADAQNNLTKVKAMASQKSPPNK